MNKEERHDKRHTNRVHNNPNPNRMRARERIRQDSRFEESEIHKYKWPVDEDRFDEYPRYGSNISKKASHQGQTNFEGVGPRGYKRSDARIEEEICEILARDKYLDASEISVLVENGLVKLDGSVNYRQDRVAAEMLVENVWGVQDIENNITVKRNFRNNYEGASH